MRLLSTVLAMALSIPAASTADTPIVPDPTAVLIADLKDKALTFYKPEVTEEARRLSLCTLIEENANIQRMGDFALGRTRHQVSEAKRAVYYGWFKAALVKIFDRAFSRLNSGSASVDPQVKMIGAHQVVTVYVNATNRSENKIQFFMGEDSSKKLRVEDAALNGLRLIMYQRDEFQGIMNRSPEATSEDKVSALITELSAVNMLCP